ncbi:MAG: hypothetical protein JWP78_1371 [Mucilaginibacter sp.]|nr:hypothetical protein [Mucilaginibacter sp.]
MGTLQENILKLIGEQCSPRWELEEYRGHIIINLPDTEEDYRAICQQVKKEITKCVQQHFPERDTELLFEVRNGSWNFSFKLRKIMITGP